MILAGVGRDRHAAVAGLAVNIVIAWHLYSRRMHLVFAWHTRTSERGVEVLLAWSNALISIYLLAATVAAWCADSGTGLYVPGKLCSIHGVGLSARGAGRRLAALRRCGHANSRGHDLADLAVSTEWVSERS